ncbi:MAG: hypothetical protein RB191_21500 [Terriglobia bacterium]|nr:hypothetical protein [Terriglobia bacterium]
MACLICGARKTIDAHLVPRAFALEVTSKAGEKHAIASANEARFHTTNTGVYDSNILCGKCDGLLGRHENYVFNCLKQVREQLAAPGTLLRAVGVDGDTFVKFAAGVCWKYCVTLPEYGRISVGPYVNTLADAAFERTALPDTLDVTAVQLQAGDKEAYFYRTPMPDRKSGVNVIRFSVGGFVFFLKTDKRPNPSFPPAECWLRTKLHASFAIAPAEMFEEWTLHAKMRSQTPIRSYFNQMLEKMAH